MEPNALHIPTAFNTLSEVAPEVISNRSEVYGAQRDIGVAMIEEGMLDLERVKRLAVRDHPVSREGKREDLSGSTRSLAV